MSEEGGNDFRALLHALFQLGDESLERLQKRAKDEGVDFYRLVASEARKVPIERVTVADRTFVKNALFFWMYRLRPAEIQKALTKKKEE